MPSVGFGGWLLSIGLDPADFNKLPPETQNGYREAFRQYSDNYLQQDQAMDPRRQFEMQREMDIQMNPDGWKSDTRGGNKRRKNQFELNDDANQLAHTSAMQQYNDSQIGKQNPFVQQREKQQLDYNDSQSYKTLMGLLGPRFKGGW